MTTAVSFTLTLNLMPFFKVFPFRMSPFTIGQSFYLPPHMTIYKLCTCMVNTRFINNITLCRKSTVKKCIKTHLFWYFSVDANTARHYCVILFMQKFFTSQYHLDIPVVTTCWVNLHVIYYLYRRFHGQTS